MNNKQIYQQNIFLQKKKEKFNPDVETKKKNEEKARVVSVFKKSNVTYNSITNQTPQIVKSQKDLELNKDIPLDNINQIIAQKMKEREEQDQVNKPQKQKIVMEETTTEIKPSIEDFNDMKLEQKEQLDKQNKIIENNKNKYEDIMCNLKKLGILNN